MVGRQTLLRLHIVVVTSAGIPLAFEYRESAGTKLPPWQSGINWIFQKGDPVMRRRWPVLLVLLGMMTAPFLTGCEIDEDRGDRDHHWRDYHHYDHHDYDRDDRDWR